MRHPSLIPLSHDHQHALAQALALRRAAGADPEGRREAARGFLALYGAETVVHFREEEEQVLPLLVGPDGALPAVAERVLREHVRLHALAGRLAAELARGEVAPEALRDAGDLLHDHVRLEEREVFPLVERAAAPEALAALTLGAAGAARADDRVVDLEMAAGRGAVWAAAGFDLNVTLVAWPPGEGVEEHVNLEREVLVVALAGEGVLRLDGEDLPLRAPALALVPRGRARAVRAGLGGLRYLSVHLLRPAGLPLGRARG